MRCLLLVSALGVGCSVDLGYEQTTVEFGPISPPAPSGGADPIVAAGATMLTGCNISEDDGVTWAPCNPAIDPTFAQAFNEGELLVNTTLFGWGRWNMGTDQVVAIAPPIATVGAMLALPNGTLLAHSPGSATMMRQNVGLVWSQVTLPTPPSAPGGAPNVYDIAVAGNNILLIADWGVYRSIDDGASWLYLDDPDVVGRLLTLPDGRVAVLNQIENQILDVRDSAGTSLGITSPVFPGSTSNVVATSCLGALIHDDVYSTDLGQTWTPLMPDVPGVTWEVGRVACGGDYLAVHLNAPSDWLMKMTELGQVGSLYTYTPAVGGIGLEGAFVRLIDGTVLSNNLAWKPGDAGWQIRPLPVGFELHALADNSVLGFDAQFASIARSMDAGLTWSTTMLATPAPPMRKVFVDSTGTLWGPVLNAGSPQLWRSDDDGLTWTKALESATDSTAALVAIGPDDTFVSSRGGTDLHVSRDRGASWESLPFPEGYSLKFITPRGNALTYDRNDNQGMAPSFHLWSNYGLGSAYEQRTPLVPTVDMGPQPADLGPILTSMSIDAAGFARFTFGTGAAKSEWASAEPID